jgi:uncharacterized membrane protein (DUF4010 family)
MFEWTTELRFVVALALGFLVGLERESAKVGHRGRIVGGVRTFPIISLYGFACAWLYQTGATVVLPVGLLSIGFLTVVSYYDKMKEGFFGATSEISALLTFAVGALALLTHVWVAMALGIVNTILLSEKAELETYVERLSRVEFLAVLKFLVVTVIILPVLPNRELTAYKLNPARIWETVILVSTVGFVGYILAKRFGSKVGLGLSGILGGIVSSTAAVIALGRIARQESHQTSGALRASILAGSVMYIRILILVGVLSPSMASALWWKAIVLAAAGIVLAWTIREPSHRPEKAAMPSLQNPFDLKPAILFAGLFVLLSVLSTIVMRELGNAGVLSLSALVGVTDIDPFILSLAHNPTGGLPLAVAAVVLAMMSNTVMKGIYFAVLAPKARTSTLVLYAIWAVLHLPLIFIF